MLTIVECVEINGNLVIFKNFLALNHPCPDLARIVLTHEYDIQIFIVVGQVGDSLLANRLTISRLALTKVRDPSLGFPRYSIYKIVKPWRPRYLGYGEGASTRTS